MNSTIEPIWKLKSSSGALDCLHITSIWSLIIDPLGPDVAASRSNLPPSSLILDPWTISLYFAKCRYVSLYVAIWRYVSLHVATCGEVSLCIAIYIYIYIYMPPHGSPKLVKLLFLLIIARSILTKSGGCGVKSTHAFDDIPSFIVGSEYVHGFV